MTTAIIDNELKNNFNSISIKIFIEFLLLNKDKYHVFHDTKSSYSMPFAYFIKPNYISSKDTVNIVDIDLKDYDFFKQSASFFQRHLIKNIIKVHPDIQTVFYAYWFENLPKEYHGLLFEYSTRIIDKKNSLEYFKNKDLDLFLRDFHTKIPRNISILNNNAFLELMDYYFSLSFLSSEDKITHLIKFFINNKKLLKRIEIQNVIYTHLKNTNVDYSHLMQYIPDIKENFSSLIFSPSFHDNLIRLNKKNIFSHFYSSEINDKYYITQSVILTYNFLNYPEILKKINIENIFLHFKEESKEKDYLFIVEYNKLPVDSISDIIFSLIEHIVINKYFQMEYTAFKLKKPLSSFLDSYLLEKKLSYNIKNNNIINTKKSKL